MRGRSPDTNISSTQDGGDGMNEPRNIWNLECELGEGPVWVDGALWFVDIKKHKIYRYEPANFGLCVWDAPEQVGFILRGGGGGGGAGRRGGRGRGGPGGGAGN